jgi:cleavage and polyadenylation specificity factor subunit 2
MIVHGSKEATMQLQEYCINSESITNEVFTPVIDERVAVSNATNLYQVVLTDSLVSSLRLSTVRIALTLVE